MLHMTRDLKSFFCYRTSSLIMTF